MDDDALEYGAWTLALTVGMLRERLTDEQILWLLKRENVKDALRTQGR